MRIFITGGTGFIGKPLVKSLIKRGHNLLLLSRQPQKSSANLKFIKGDLSNNSWYRKVRLFKPDACVHLAWQDLPNYDAQTSQRNLFQGLNLYNFLAQIGCKKIVTTGSCSEYGMQKGRLSEDSQVRPLNAFAAAKNALNRLGSEIAMEKDIKFIWTRIFFCYGPGQRKTSLIPSLINYKNGKAPKIAEPDTRLDFIFIEDVAEAIAKLLENAKTSGNYNIGSGRLTSIRRIIKTTGKLLDKEKEFEKLVSHRSKAKWSDFYADISKIKKETGWMPKTDIDDGIRKTIESFSYCPVCNSERVEIFYRQKRIPVVNNVFYKTKSIALKAPEGGVDLAFCKSCGFIFNSKFDSNLTKYNEAYTTSRSSSSFYRKYLQVLAKKLAKKHDIRNKRILEIGCWDGEFLKILCRESESSGIGIDPAYQGPAKVGKVRFIKDYFPSEKKSLKLEADICILRHTLEHIDNPYNFINKILDEVIFDKGLTLVIEVPDFAWIAIQGAYWDVTYEHVNYFDKNSLGNLLKLCGFSSYKLFSTFGNQYLVAIAMHKGERGDVNLRAANKDNIYEFLKNIRAAKERINKMIKNIPGQFTIWGMSGKGVIFTNLLPKSLNQRIPFVLDDDEGKQGKYSSGVGHLILPHKILKEKPIRNILVMNPNYFQEMGDKLRKLGVEAKLINV